MTAVSHSAAADFARFRTRLLALSVGSVLLSVVLLFVLILGPFERDLLPEMDAKVAAVDRALEAELTHALDLGIPLNGLVGVNSFFDQALKSNPELAYIAITDPAGHVLFWRGATGLAATSAAPATLPPPDSKTAASLRDLGQYRDRWAPLRGNGQVVGAIELGLPLSFVRNSMLSIALDLAVAVVVSLLVTFEILLFLTNRALAAPMSAISDTLAEGSSGSFRHVVDVHAGDEMAQIAASLNGLVLSLHARSRALGARLAALPREMVDQGERLAGAVADLARFSFADGERPLVLRREILSDIRAPLFLYVLAGEMSRSFFPNFVQSIYTPIPGLSRDAVLGLPISAFMFMVAAATPYSGKWCDRYGGRRLFLMSMAPTLIGMIGAGLSTSIYELLVFWAINAVGYSMATIACQTRIAESTTSGNRAVGMSQFVAAIMVAAICGTSLGGVMSDRIGFRATLICSSFLVVLAGGIVASVFARQTKGGPARQTRSMWQAIKASAGNVRFLALMVFGAIPAKIILTGFLYYTVPLYLSALGYSESTIGRAMMVYFVIMVFGSSFFARIADKHGLRLSLVASGGVIAGLGAMILPMMGGISGVLVAVVLLGLGHAQGTAPLIAMIPEICERETRAVGQAALLGVLRVTERVGSVLGPILAAVLATAYSYETAARVIGLIVATAALLLVSTFLFWNAGTAKSGAAEEAS